MTAPKDPFDKVLQVVGLYQDIEDTDPISPDVIPVSQGNQNEVPCRVRVRGDAGNLLTIADIPDIQEDLRRCWIVKCIKLIHRTPNTTTHIRPMAFILDLDGTVHAELEHIENQTGNYPARCRIPPSTISDLPLQERLWRAEKFALGTLLYEIITSHSPFEADDRVQAHYKAAEFPEDIEEMDLSFQCLLYSCWSAEFGHYIALGKFRQYVHDNPARFTLQVASATIGVAALATIPVLGAIGFSPLGPVGGSIAAGWQSSIGAVEAGSLFAFCQSAAMGGVTASRLIGAGSTIAVAASRLPNASSLSLRETFIRKFRRGPTNPWTVAMRMWTKNGYDLPP